VAESVPAAPARRRTRPTFLFVLAIAGAILGAFGAMYAIATSPVLFGPRDAYVKAFREATVKSLPPIAPVPQMEAMAEREADVRYGRRNAQLPLNAIALIVSCLLFAGCTRALRGQAWGAAAWSLAATVAIPYQLLDTAMMLVMARDLEAAFRTLPQPLGFLRIASLELEVMLKVIVTGLEIVYFGACIMYLRLPTVRALFSDGTGRTTPSA
jgi:hypothetical protein